MREFPPAAENQVTLSNWRTAPFSSWAFSHVREIIQTADIPNNPADIWDLQSAPHDLSGLPVDYDLDLNGYLDATYTDAFTVIHKGKIIVEEYRNASGRRTPHILMSVSKSMLGALSGILADKGVLDTAALVTDYVPEIAGTSWSGASVQNVLDMRAGIRFDEDYEATGGAIIEYRKSTGWNPLEPGESASDLRSFFNQISDTDGPHLGRFHYVSPNTDLMAWIIERAAGIRYADLMAEHLWQPMGAETPAYITVDRLGAPRAAGGMCVSLRDLARVGMLVANRGKRGAAQVLPEAWIDDVLNNGDREAWDQGDFAGYFPGKAMHYRNKWYVERGENPMMFCIGIHGQNLYVMPGQQLVVAKMSSRPKPLDPQVSQLNLKMISALKQHFDAG
ncbi:serine hydrolase domain-containing protein [Anderseniella sp. Alg231-50]|uniref:serine hydrolase domain-containing protein n=1 Tax=Anderseniella sp. Alg231-50 TaxID=1922226 RepID=UPI00307B4345